MRWQHSSGGILIPQRLAVESLPGFSKIDDFGASTSFAKFGSTGTVAADNTTGYRSGTSIKMTPVGDATYVDIRANKTAINATGKTLALAYYMPNLANVTSWQVTVGTDTALANRYRWSGFVGTQVPSRIRTDGWDLITLDWGDGASSGSFDRTSVQEYQIRIQGNAAVPCWMGYLAWFNSTPKYGSVSFDDGYESVYLQAYPILSALGIPFTVYMPYSYLGVGGRLSLTEINTMIASGLCEVGYHDTGNDQRVNTSAQVEALITTAISGWASNGISLRGSAYPGGQWGLTTDSVLLRDIYARHFPLARTIFQGCVESIPAPDTMLLRVFPYVYYTTTTTTVANAITEVANNGGWSHQVYHDIVTGVPTTDQYNVTDFQTNMNALVASGLPLRKVSKVLFP